MASIVKSHLSRRKTQEATISTTVESGHVGHAEPGINRHATPPRTLDRTDLLILATLQENGRLTNVALSQKTNITAPPCLRRVRALEDDGYIRGYHAELNATKLGFTVTAFVLVGLTSQAALALKQFEGSLRQWPIVRECFALSGEMDFILRCVARDLNAFQAFITDSLMPNPHVKTVKTMMTMGTVKNEPGLPISTAGPAKGQPPQTPSVIDRAS